MKTKGIYDSQRAMQKILKGMLYTKDEDKYNQENM